MREVAVGNLIIEIITYFVVFSAYKLQIQLSIMFFLTNSDL